MSDTLITIYRADEGVTIELDGIPYVITHALDTWDVEDIVSCLHGMVAICGHPITIDVEVKDVRGEG